MKRQWHLSLASVLLSVSALTAPSLGQDTAGQTEPASATASEADPEQATETRSGTTNEASTAANEPSSSSRGNSAAQTRRVPPRPQPPGTSAASDRQTTGAQAEGRPGADASTAPNELNAPLNAPANAPPSSTRTNTANGQNRGAENGADPFRQNQNVQSRANQNAGASGRSDELMPEPPVSDRPQGQQRTGEASRATSPQTGNAAAGGQDPLDPILAGPPGAQQQEANQASPRDAAASRQPGAQQAPSQRPQQFSQPRQAGVGADVPNQQQNLRPSAEGTATDSFRSQPDARANVSSGAQGNVRGNIQSVEELGFSLQATANNQLTVSNVAQGSFAARLGLRAGDTILSVAGRPITSQAQLTQVLTSADVEQIPLLVERNGVRETLYVRASQFQMRQDAGVAQAEFRTPATSSIDLGVDFQSGDNGLVIANIPAQSLAARVGLFPGDVILGVAGQPVRTEVELYRILTGFEGDRVPLIVLRDGVRDVVYVSRPQFAPERMELRGAVAANAAAQAWLGVFLDERFSDRAVVTSVQAGSPAERAGVRPGDWIASINGQEIQSPSHLTSVIRSMRPGDPIAIGLNRPTAAELQAVLSARPQQEASAGVQQQFTQEPPVPTAPNPPMELANPQFIAPAPNPGFYGPAPEGRFERDRNRGERRGLFNRR